MKIFPFVLACGVLVSSGAQAGKLTGNPDSVALFVSELVDVANNPAVTAKAGPLSYDGRNYGISQLGSSRFNAGAFVGQISPFVPAATVAPAPPPPTIFSMSSDPSTPDNSLGTVCQGVPLPPEQSEVQAQATHYLQSNYAQVTGPMLAYMKKYGIPFAVFRYEATVPVAVDRNAAVVTNPNYSPPDNGGSGPGDTGSGGGGTASLRPGRIPVKNRVYLAALSGTGFVSGGLSGVDTVDPYLCDPSQIKMVNRTLVWTLTLDQTGKATYPQATLKAGSSNLVHAVYYSLAVRDLPSSFAYPQGGYIMYQEVDAHMNALTQMQSYNVHGAYDSTDNSPAAVNAAATCAANDLNVGTTVTCPTPGLPDVKTFLDRTGVSGGLFDYVESVSPQYTTISETAVGGAPTAVQVPVWALYEQSRRLDFPDCGYASYTNQGYYQVQINSTISRFFVQPNGVASLANQVVGHNTTSPSAFNWSVQLDPAGAASVAAGQVLDPRDGQALINIQDLGSGLQQLANVVSSGQVPTSSYYAYGNLQICDVASHQKISASCPTGYALGLDTASQPYAYNCTAAAAPSHSCPDGSVTASGTCYAQPSVTAAPW